MLAAGLSARFGGDKLLHPYRGRPLAAHIAGTLAALPLARRIAVCPAADASRAALFLAGGFDIVENPDPGRGMGSSLALGARRALALGVQGLLVCLADMPNVTARHLAALFATARTADVVATSAGNMPGPPALFAAERLPELARITGDRGARDLLANAALVEASADLVRDFDRPEDFERG